MPPSGGKRTPLVTVASDSYALAGDQNAMRRFRLAYGNNGVFGPGEPLVPPAPEKARVWDFPVAWNTIYTPRAYEPISFAELRALADSHDITRLAIETRKDQVEGQSWSIRSIDEKNPAADADSRIAAVTDFWRSPDGEQPFGGWLREAMEDLFVLDAPVFEVRRNRGGGIIGLDVIDGSTIQVLIDDTGRRPKPPVPAFEQVIHGRPWRLMTSDDLIYMPRNRRPHKAYGFGPVEQIIMSINIGLRRQVMQLQHFTEGNVPAGLLNAPEDWTAEQIKQYQAWFDATLAGNTAERSKVLWGPSGAKYQSFKEPPYKDDFDEWLARVVCAAFRLAPNAFIRQVQRTTADTLQEAALKEGLGPVLQWVKRLADHVIQDKMGHKDLEFQWDEEEALDPQSEAVRLIGLVKEGLFSRNEARGMLGYDPIEGGDVAAIDNPSGPIPVSTLPAIATAPEPDEQPPEPGDEPVPAADKPDGEEAAAKAARPFREARAGSPRRAAQPSPRDGARGAAPSLLPAPGAAARAAHPLAYP